MEAGPWTGKGYSAPWMYHRVAGQYMLFEKQLVSNFSPGQRRRPSHRILQDSTNWHEAQPPPQWGSLRQESPCFSEKRAATCLKPHNPHGPTYDGFSALCRRELAWEAAAAAAHAPKTAAKDRGAPDGSQGPLGALRKIRGDLHARSPPSYEAHMRRRAGPGSRKENWPHPPPYVAPPSYEAPHRTVRPQPRACRAASAAGRPEAPSKRPERTCEGGPRTPTCGWKKGQCQAMTVPDRWSYLAGARTWAGRRRQPERAEAPSSWSPGWPSRSPVPPSHTLPRATKRLPASCPVPNSSFPHSALPPGWRTHRAVAWPGGKGSPEGKVHSSWPGEPGGSLAVGPRARPRRPGGVMVIDATCVVIQTHYIPPARTERVRYVEPEGAEQSPAATASSSLQERASRILGLPLSELSFMEQGGPPAGSASPKCKAEARSPLEATAVAGAAPGPAQPECASSSTQGSPNRAPKSILREPPDMGLTCLRRADPGLSGNNCAPQAETEASCDPRNGSYVLDLRKAMSKIRRHTAPDSDTDEELEKEPQPAKGHFSWKGHLNEGALSYSSSSSLESSDSNATVVPGSAKNGPLSSGSQKGWRPSPAVSWQ